MADLDDLKIVFDMLPTTTLAMAAQASLVAAFAQEQAAKAAQAFEQLTSDSDLFQSNELLKSIQPNVAITEQSSVLAALPNTSNSSNARWDGDLHGLAEAEEAQYLAAACEASNSAMQLVGMALAEAEVRLYVKQMTSDIFRNVERAATTHQLEVLYQQLQQSQAQLKSARNQLVATAPCVLRPLPQGMAPQAECPCPAPGAMALKLHDDMVVINNDGEGSCSGCCAEPTDANGFVLVEFGEEM
eukprot:gene9272-9437_t